MQNRRQHQFPVPNATVAVILRQDGVRDEILEGRGLVFDNPPAPPVELPSPMVIPPFDADEPEPAPRSAGKGLTAGGIDRWLVESGFARRENGALVATAAGADVAGLIFD
jgi:hypothetical protein